MTSDEETTTMTDLPGYEGALAQAMAAIDGGPTAETVETADAVGRVLLEPVVADRALPPFDRSQMDGYAVRSSEIGRHDSFEVCATISAGQPADVVVPEGACVAIATGAPVPSGLDAVIPHESSDRSQPVSFTVASVEPGSFIHKRGADAGEGDVVISAPRRLGAHHVGILAMVGCTTITAARQPRVCILSSGDELVAADRDVLTHQIRNSNGPMLRHLVTAMGAEVTTATHVLDDLDATTEAVRMAFAEAEVLITIGGVSAGERDFFPAAFEDRGVTTHLRKAAIQPGRPIRIGTTEEGRIVIALPGNPVSALTCACLFAWPIVRALSGLPSDLPWRTLTLAEPVRPNPRRQVFRPATLKGGNRVLVPRWAGSGDLCHADPTDGLLALPVQGDIVEAGTNLRFLPWP